MTEFRDQSAHFATAFLLVMAGNLVGATIGPMIGALYGLAWGLIRELTEEGEVSPAAVRRAFRSRLDLTFWTLGGLVAGILEII